MVSWWLAGSLVGAAAHDSHGPGPWMVDGRPVLRPLDGQLGWRLATADRWGEPTRRYLEAVNELLGDPLHKANAYLNWETGQACYNASAACTSSLGPGVCDLNTVFAVVAKSLRMISVAQDTLEEEFHKVCEQTFGTFERSVRLGLGHPVETARSAFRRASSRMKSLQMTLREAAISPCSNALGEVLYANVDVSRIGLETTSLLDHQLIVESCDKNEELTEELTELKLPHAVHHRHDLGLHHNEIVVSLLSKLLPRAKSQGREELVMVEVGTALAEFTVHVLGSFAKVQVITIDPWAYSGGSEDSAVARRALEPWSSRVVVLEMTGEKAAKLLADAAYDLVFIDSGYHREGDVISFLPKVRQGGILCGHDFYKTHAYTRSVLAASVPSGKPLNVGPDWMWWFEV